MTLLVLFFRFVTERVLYAKGGFFLIESLTTNFIFLVPLFASSTSIWMISYCETSEVFVYLEDFLCQVVSSRRNFCPVASFNY